MVLSILLLQKWKYFLNNGECVCVLFMNLSEASETIYYKLLLAKFKAHDFSENAVNVIHSYLGDRKQNSSNKQHI